MLRPAAKYKPYFPTAGKQSKSETGTICLRRYAPQPNDKPYFPTARKQSIIEKQT